jgi:hypothetical protein
MEMSGSSMRLAIVFLSLLAGGHNTHAEVRRALVVGINLYLPKGLPEDANGNPAQPTTNPQAGRLLFTNLDGCVNDARAVEGLLAARYDFKPSYIHILLDAQATRKAILEGIQEHLIDEAAPGDLCFFYYAGHGSRIRNLRSNKPSGMDSTIVPADSWSGAMDIRDKELARLFNRALDKGVILTAVFDSCHSGAIARGLPRQGKSRDLPPDSRTISDPPDPGPAPEERGALVISAAQDYQSALEGTDEDGLPHGAFTVAFLKALRSSPMDAPAAEFFLSTQTLLQAECADQLPVLAGTAERRREGLFGSGAAARSGKITLAAESFDLGTGMVVLNGGQVIGLEDGCELQRLPRTAEVANTPSVRLRVAKVDGFARATAVVLDGSKDVRAGDLFEVDHWVYPNVANLRVWIPESDLTWNELRSLAAELSRLRDSAAIHWIADPTEETPAEILSWGQFGWTLNGTRLGKVLHSQDVIKRLGTSTPGGTKLFVNLPPPRELGQGINIGEGSPNSSISRAGSGVDSNYQLVGRCQDGRFSYAWVRPNSIARDKDLSPFPARSDWFEIRDPSSDLRLGKIARDLENTALQIGRLKAWLTLDPRGVSGYFPYRLALRNTLTKQVKGPGDSVFKGEPYGLLLLADANSNRNRYRVAQRWIYVLGIDSWGKTQLIFPASTQGNVGNRVPYDLPDDEAQTYPVEIPLGDPENPAFFTVAPPFGIDTFILVTSTEPIPQPDLLNGEGIRTRSGSEETPLQTLLLNLGARSRGFAPASAPTNWSIQRVSIRSAEN